MKRILPRLIFPAIVAAAAAFAYYESRRAARESLSEAKAAAFFSERLEDLVKIHLKSQKGETLLIKKGRDWLMEKPLEDKASFKEISRWLEEIKSQKTQKISVEGEIDWKDYHLEEGQAAHALLEFSGNPQKTLSFSISRKSSYDGRFFLNKGGELFLGERYFESEISGKDPESFRSKKILPSLGHAKKIVFEGKEKITLLWSDYKWSLGGGAAFPLNEPELKSFWASLSQAEAEALRERRSPGSIKKRGLARPQAKIALDYGEGGEVRMEISPFREGKAYVSSSRRDFLFEVSESEAEKWLLSEERIWDGKAPFRYEKKKAAYLELKSHGRSYSLKKKERPMEKRSARRRRKKSKASKPVWEIALPSAPSEKGNPAGQKDGPPPAAPKSQKDAAKAGGSGAAKPAEKPDTKSVEAVLNVLRDLKGKKRKPLRAKKPARAKPGYFAVRDSGGDLLFELLFDERDLKSAGGQLVWVQTSLSKDLAAIPKTALKNLLKMPVYQSQPPANPPAESAAKGKAPPAKSP